MGRTVIELDAVGKRYRLGEHHGTGTDLRETLSRLGGRLRGRQPAPVREIWSLRDVSFAVEQGQSLGIIGSNGAGKSTLLKVINGITTPTSGRSRTRGRIGSLLEVGTGFHGELTGLENTYLNGAILGMTRQQVTRRLDEIVAFAGLEKFMDTPVKRYSSGMYLRLGFAIAAHMEADILLVDEVLAVGDAEFQRRCLGKMDEVERSGRTVLFVSHNLEAMARVCPTSIWLDGGRVRAIGKTSDIVDQYLRSSRPAARRSTFEIDDSRPAQLTGVTLRGPDGGEVSTLGLGMTVWVELDVRVTEPVPGINLSCAVCTESGATILDEALGDTGDLPFDRPGHYVVRCEIPDVLPPGRYHVDTWMGTPYEELEVRSNVLTFDVEGETDRDRAVRLRTAWQVVPPTP
jgi:ABC-type polysaccharide/polyol phosphate transport system ATPase subunit